MLIELVTLVCLRLLKNPLSAGIRRVVALTGKRALKDIQKNHLILQSLQKSLNILF